MRAANGLDVIVEFANSETGLALIPLVQHFTSVNGPTGVNQRAPRLIAPQPFAEDCWVKLDAKVPHDWENGRWPASAEVQLGKSIISSMAVYAAGLLGIGGNRPSDAGNGLSLRFGH